MDRETLLKVAKPILFNTKMVRAILDGRKTVTRRVVKQGEKSTPDYHGRDKFYSIVDHLNNDYKHYYAGFYNDYDVFYVDGKKNVDAIYFKAQYKPGDILYVRETWCKSPFTDNYIYRADGESELFSQSYDSEIMDDTVWTWKPSIHMPKEAARIFLKVKNVRVERLQDITEEQAEKEGCEDYTSTALGFYYIWDSTIKKSDLDRYGWNANPWVWVIEFERIFWPKGKGEAC